jgi:uroporphyrin-III C-methyltransferase/precorrin-2 dehydrogenase/sirohydrochlorin ferrochelatase
MTATLTTPTLPEPRSPRMERLARLPVFFALEGRPAVVAGGTPGAAWKAELLSAAGAEVTVYATNLCDEMIGLATNPPRGAVTIHHREWASRDIIGMAMAVGAFDNDDDARRFSDAAHAAGVPVNVVDNPKFCDFAFGAIVNRSPLVIGISTDGAAPVFSQAIRGKLETLIPRGFAHWADAARRWRGNVKAAGLSFGARRRFWQLFTERAVRHPDAEPQPFDYELTLQQTLAEGERVERGTVTLVGAGPGDPELLTLRAMRALQSADVILFDERVSIEILDFARREAKKLLVGKASEGSSGGQDGTNGLMVGLAKSGRRVVRLSGGDPTSFGHNESTIAACRRAGIAVEVVPGVTEAGRIQSPGDQGAETRVAQAGL